MSKLNLLIPGRCNGFGYNEIILVLVTSSSSGQLVIDLLSDSSDSPIEFEHDIA